MLLLHFTADPDSELTREARGASREFPFLRRIETTFQKERLLNQASAHQARQRLTNLMARGQGPASAISGAGPDHWADDPEALLIEAYRCYRHSKRNHRSIREIERIFQRYILPVFGDVRVATIDRTAVTRLLDMIANNELRPAPVMARAVASQLSAFFSWTIARSPFLGENPCRLAARPPKPRPRTRIMCDRELHVLWQILGQESMPWNAAIKLILLTGQRRGEVFDADWSEFDFNRRLWTIPARHSKNGREHRVPLSDLAIRLLGEIPRGVGPKLFPARGHPTRGASGFSKAMKRITAAVGAATDNTSNFTLQDLRRTVATGLQRLGVRLEVTECVLNHASGSRDGIVGIYQLYQFEDEKRVALEQWASELARIVDPSANDGCSQSGENQCR